MSESRSTTSGNFSATDLRRRMAERNAAKAAEEMRRIKEQEDKLKAVMGEFRTPSGEDTRTADGTHYAARQPGCRARTERGSDLSLSKFLV
jgi:hypothetical protein